MKKVRVKLLWKPSRLLMNYFENIHTEAIYLKERTKAFSDQIREGGIQRVQSPSFSLNNFYMVEQLFCIYHVAKLRPVLGTIASTGHKLQANDLFIF